MSSFNPSLVGEQMVLRSSDTSPFGRKVRIVFQVLGLQDRFVLEAASTLDENDAIRQQNPLGKIPCLLLSDGTVLFDSRTIIEFLCSLVEGQTLLPANPLDLARERTEAVMGDGIADAALLMVYEDRFRRPDQRSDVWLDHQRGKVLRTLSHFEENLPVIEPQLSLSGISLCCALGYLDWRQPVRWRDAFPRLVEWLDAFGARFPELAATRPNVIGEGLK